MARLFLVENNRIFLDFRRIHFVYLKSCQIYGLKELTSHQGCNARTVISEVYASFVLQCTVTGR